MRIGRLILLIVWSIICVGVCEEIYQLLNGPFIPSVRWPPSFIWQNTVAIIVGIVFWIIGNYFIRKMRKSNY